MGRRKAAADAPPKGANGSAAALGFNDPESVVSFQKAA